MPQPIKLETPVGRFAQAARSTQKGVHLEAFFSQPERRVTAAEYRGLVHFSVAVDRAEARAAELVRANAKSAAAK